MTNVTADRLMKAWEAGSIALENEMFTNMGIAKPDGSKPSNDEITEALQSGASPVDKEEEQFVLALFKHPRFLAQVEKMCILASHLPLEKLLATCMEACIVQGRHMERVLLSGALDKVDSDVDFLEKLFSLESASDIADVLDQAGLQTDPPNEN